LLDRTHRTRRLKRERKRRYKQRVDAGIVVVPVPIDASVYEMLIRLHWCTERELCDRRIVGEVIGRELIKSAAKLGL
jgi:hypothetical protein